MRRALSLCAGAALLAAASLAHADTAPSIEAVLAANQGKQVTLKMEGGGELTGTVAALSPVTLKLTSLTGTPESYGAVIRLERIHTVIVREPSK